MKEQENPDDNYEVNHNPERKLGIIAGGGELPHKVIEWCQKHSRPYYALAIEGKPKLLNARLRIWALLRILYISTTD